MTTYVPRPPYEDGELQELYPPGLALEQVIVVGLFFALSEVKLLTFFRLFDMGSAPRCILGSVTSVFPSVSSILVNR